MTGQLIGQLILWLILAVIVIFILYWVMNWLYRRSTKEVAFVRTGFLGEKGGDRRRCIRSGLSSTTSRRSI